MMALHGSIIVTDNVIGYWTATRTITRPKGEPWTYRCDVRMLDPLGRRDAGVDLTFDLDHMYEDGALALAAKVLSKAASR